MTRQDWNTWRFAQIAVNINDRVEPGDTGLEYYVGLEHLDCDSLKIRRWGTPDDVGATKLRFRKGDIIFGRRRAYQRKLAVADFDGICSAHAMVLRAKPDLVLPEFLPFFMQSDLFMNRAVEISVGSLSPTINWKTLAAQEFALPPLEEQRRIAELLGSLTFNLDRLHDSMHAGKVLLQSMTDAHVMGDHKSRKVRSSPGNSPAEWPLVPLARTFVATQYGLSVTPQSQGQYPILRMMNIENRLIVENDIKYVDLSDKELQAYQLNYGDVLFNRTNSYELVGRTGVYKLDGDHVFASYLVRVQTDCEMLLPDYLAAFLNSSPGRRQILSYATRGVSQTNVNASNLGEIKIPLPPVSEQKFMIEEQGCVWNSILQLGSRHEKLQQMRKKVTDELLGDRMT